jgi:hypothetical protein
MITIFNVALKYIFKIFPQPIIANGHTTGYLSNPYRQAVCNPVNSV